MMKTAVFALAFLVALAVPAAAQSELTVELVINNTSHDVYIPETGEVASSTLGTFTTYNPSTYWITSYLSGLVVGLAGETGQDLSTEGAGGTHTIGFSQVIGERVFLAFTEGDEEIVEGRMTDIEGGDFLNTVSPSFAYGLGSYHPLMVILTYSGIDIDGSLSASKGIYKLVIENKGQSGGVPVVSITG